VAERLSVSQGILRSMEPVQHISFHRLLLEMFLPSAVLIIVCLPLKIKAT
jgi:hypothetical protein